MPVALGLAKQLGAQIELVTVHEPMPGRHNISGSSAHEHVLERELIAARHAAAVRSLDAVRDGIIQRADAPVVTTTVLPASRRNDYWNTPTSAGRPCSSSPPTDSADRPVSVWAQ
ncbi:hypothetical protein [Gemmatimonas sp.]|uniref:hypothetical protein n=1 Tax=Gemmatimonas sp. TaxID=1962908 RepID=UPI0035649733